jgi:hypothetical protein
MFPAYPDLNGNMMNDVQVAQQSVRMLGRFARAYGEYLFEWHGLFESVYFWN